MLAPGNGAAPCLDVPQSGPAGYDFLVVCSDYSSFKIIAAAIHQSKGRLYCAPSAAKGCEYISRKNVDGIVIDMSLAGSLELISHVRGERSNRCSVVFACMSPARETQFVIRAGANFVLHPPLLADQLVRVFSLAAGTMAARKRRCVRFPLILPVELKVGQREFEGTISDLSQGGMAIWSTLPQSPRSIIQFDFQLPFGGSIQGMGEVAWANADGRAGIKFQAMPEQAHLHLSAWLARRDPSSTS